jgi:hypothetical protein
MNIAREKGTLEWFEASRMRCVDHLRALLAIKMSKSNIAELLRGWDLHSAEIKNALHSNSVVSYARVFVHSAAHTGKITYPSRRLVQADGFDRELHEHIVDLRNQIVAHNDYGVFPSTMYLQTIGDERLPVALGVNVKGIFGIASRELAERYERHFTVCDSKLEELLNRECAELAAEAKVYPETFKATHNIPQSRESFVTGDSFGDLPPPTGPAGRVEDPSLAEGLSSYSYLTLTHQIALLTDGEYTITTNGTQQTIELSSKSGR